MQIRCLAPHVGMGRRGSARAEPAHSCHTLAPDCCLVRHLPYGALSSLFHPGESSCPNRPHHRSLGPLEQQIPAAHDPGSSSTAWRRTCPRPLDSPDRSNATRSSPTSERSTLSSSSSVIGESPASIGSTTSATSSGLASSTTTAAAPPRTTSPRSDRCAPTPAGSGGPPSDRPVSRSSGGTVRSLSPIFTRCCISTATASGPPPR